MAPKSRNALYDGFHLIDGDQARAFKLARRILVARTPKKVLVIEAEMGIVPAAVAGVVVDHPVRCGELVERMGEAADHNNRPSQRPRKP